jgi:hypothetical protein
VIKTKYYSDELARVTDERLPAPGHQVNVARVIVLLMNHAPAPVFVIARFDTEFISTKACMAPAGNQEAPSIHA